jgi:hypothetical protein
MPDLVEDNFDQRGGQPILGETNKILSKMTNTMQTP